MGGEAEETGSRSGAAGADRELGGRLRAARQQAQGQVVESGSGHLSRWKGIPRPK